MNNYIKIVNWLQDNIIIASILILAAIIMAIPKLRDGVLCLWGWLRPKKKSSPDDPLELRIKGELVTFDELMRSIKLDIVRVNAHTHLIGVMAEHAWVSKRYPGYKLRSQALHFMKDANIGEKAFDIFTFTCADETTKQVYFEITSFFDGKVDSDSSPHDFAKKKLREIYK